MADHRSQPHQASEKQSQRYLDSEASLLELLSHLSQEERREWDGYGHLRVEPAFQDRVFVVFKAQGMDRAPKIITTVRVLSFIAKDELGCIVRLAREDTGEEMEVSHLPKKLFDFPIFTAIPPAFTIRWDAREHAGKTLRSLSYLLFLKTRNKSDFRSQGNVYCETPNKLRALYPNTDLKLEL